MLSRLRRTRWIQKRRHKSVLHSSGTVVFMCAAQNTLCDVYFIQSDRAVLQLCRYYTAQRRFYILSKAKFYLAPLWTKIFILLGHLKKSFFFV